MVDMEIDLDNDTYWKLFEIAGKKGMLIDELIVKIIRDRVKKGGKKK